MPERKRKQSMSNSAFFVGIKGVGMTSLALAMQQDGWQIKGSDTEQEFITDSVLAKNHIPVIPISSEIPEADLIVCSTAYTPPTHPNVQSLAQALADFVKDRRVIAVAGVGGKTTTSAMLAVLFNAAKRDVGYYVGTSTIAGLPTSGAKGSDPYFVVEADEYALSKTDHRPKFALLNPEIVITTNIVHDHPDIYQTKADTLAAFRSLVERIPSSGSWIYNSSDPLTQEIINNSSLSCQLIPYNPGQNNLELSVFGKQNQLDAQAAVLAAQAAGLDIETAKDAIKAYRGAGRRQESHGEHAGRLLFDDYGHHPKEIELTIQSFKEHFPSRRLLVVFESHTYTRTEALLPDFAKALSLADQTYIMPIFESAREIGQPHSVTPESFAALIKSAKAVSWDNAKNIIWQDSKPGDIILTMGAGFVYKLHDQFKKL